MCIYAYFWKKVRTLTKYSSACTPVSHVRVSWDERPGVHIYAYRMSHHITSIIVWTFVFLMFIVGFHIIHHGCYSLLLLVFSPNFKVESVSGKLEGFAWKAYISCCAGWGLVSRWQPATAKAAGWGSRMAISKYDGSFRCYLSMGWLQEFGPSLIVVECTSHLQLNFVITAGFDGLNSKIPMLHLRQPGILCRQKPRRNRKSRWVLYGS
jgi:hypothetical protein